ncbi:hypothetical protein HW115_03480 [Verrucomicrobiaceae bacterium N1E253]|uniref:Uncharacterized protein n=1 Tax=Oceaniferula marina TaxID=2748318 RepID=A0A851GHQ3_9BACT|nr:hypothetical protein [Oceaniferula marina]NWK54657.1 hypothetical protein [Oceaniferula marina]
MMNSINGLDGTQELLIKLLEQNPDDWGMRKKVVWFLYEAGYFREASKVVWNAPEIPPVDKEIVFAVRIVSKGQPTRSMRLLNAVIERNRAEPEKNLEMAKELVRGGMPLQAVRFYGAATLSDSSLIDEEFEVAMLTTDAEEEDWTEAVQSEDFPWDSPIELTEADLATEDDDEGDSEDLLSGMTQPVPLKAPVKSLKDTMNDEEKPVDLRVPTKPLPLNPDKISTAAVTIATYESQKEEDSDEGVDEEVVSDDVSEKGDDGEARDEVEEITAEDEKDEPLAEKEEESAKAEASEPVEAKDEAPEADEPVASDEEVSDSVVVLKDEEAEEDADISDVDDQVVEAEAESEPVEMLEAEPEENDEPVASSEDDDIEAEDDQPEPVAAKRGVFSSLMGFFRRSKKEDDGPTDEDILSAPDEPAPEMAKPTVVAAPAKSSMMQRPVSPVASGPGPVMGPVKPKPIPAPSEGPASGGRQFGQPEAIDCRTRLVALAPQDGSAFFSELSQKYATLPSGKMPETVTVARDAAQVDYIDLIQKACSNDKAVNLDAFSKLLGLHKVMTDADCTLWVDDMNLLRKGFGDAVLATVVSKYSVTECREILGAVYRRTATQAAV